MDVSIWAKGVQWTCRQRPVAVCAEGGGRSHWSIGVARYWMHRGHGRRKRYKLLTLGAICRQTITIHTRGLARGIACCSRRAARKHLWPFPSLAPPPSPGPMRCPYSPVFPVCISLLSALVSRCKTTAGRGAKRGRGGGMKPAWASQVKDSSWWPLSPLSRQESGRQVLTGLYPV